jgi:replicative DNA helicase
MNQSKLPFGPSEPSPESQSGGPSPVFNIRVVVDQVLDQYQKAIAGENHKIGLSTGFQQLDRMLDGLRPGLHMLSSRPSMGKTTLMLNIIEHLSADQKVPCLIFSGDLAAYHLVRRMTFSRARQAACLPLNAVTVPDESEQILLKKAATEISESPLYIEDSFDLSIESLRSIATRYQRDADIRFIAIDQLHLLRSTAMMNEPSRGREVVEIVAQLKTLSREINIPILLLSDLSRKPENRRGKQLGVPRVTDLQYYDMVEGFADTIALLYRAAFYAESEEERDALLGKSELILCKNSDGNTGFVDFHFNSMLLRFEEIESEEVLHSAGLGECRVV